ncbi:DEAD/DEAH box helicase [Candidatus Methanomethylophilus sp. 1R26]|uniref:DEAD/DEAH box helicase n=1 Tax=Candidatus Methanomethylophilus sp. 1R26 TaxID=1769296 RepID=UPI0019108AB5|nr:DEAD/DEAH box helicase [Candidatus Methanomethylophilus sp. 1R26]
MPGIAEGRLEDRRYQSEIAAECLRQNTLVILPTGLGKTAVALLAAARVLSEGKKVLMLAPTKPLVDQHSEYFSSMLDGISVGMLNGQMRPPKRAAVIAGSRFTVSTPQSVSNDLDNGVYDLSGFGMVIFDEAHRATGNYDYVNVARYIPTGCRTLGMTASPRERCLQDRGGLQEPGPGEDRDAHRGRP